MAQSAVIPQSADLIEYLCHDVLIKNVEPQLALILYDI